MRVPGLLLVVWVAVAATFAATLSGGLVYDDLHLIARNAVVLGPLDPGALLGSTLWGDDFPYWRPLTSTVLWLGWHLGGTTGIHALALLIHLGSVAALFSLVRRLGGAPALAAATALVFGVHPVHAESLGWCSAINDPLWSLCALLALREWLAPGGGTGRPWVVALFCALGLLTKETAIVIPILVAAAGWLRARAMPGAVRLRLGAFAPMLGVVVAWWLARALVFGDLRAGFDRSPIELDLSLARTMSLRVELAGRFAAAVALPVWPNTFRPVTRELSLAAPGFLVPAAVVALAIAWLIWAWRRRSLPSLLGGALLVVPLLPGLAAPHALNVYPIADRYLYLAAAGLALPLCAGLWPRRWGRVVIFAIAGAFGLGSALAIPAWRSQERFFDVHLARVPDDPRLHYTRARAHLERATAEGAVGELAAAEAGFARALELVAAPRYGGEPARVRLEADIRNGLAWCAFVREGRASRPDWARVARSFADLVARHPTFAEAHIGLASCLANLGDLDGAERHLLRALELEPSRSEARHNLELLRRERGR